MAITLGLARKQKKSAGWRSCVRKYRCGALKASSALRSRRRSSAEGRCARSVSRAEVTQALLDDVLNPPQALVQARQDAVGVGVGLLPHVGRLALGAGQRGLGAVFGGLQQVMLLDQAPGLI